MPSSIQHEVWVEEGRKVCMANNDDQHYTQEFESHDEVEELVTKLRLAAYEAFGPSPKVEALRLALDRSRIQVHDDGQISIGSNESEGRK